MSKYKGNESRIIRIRHKRVHVMIDSAAKFWDIDYQFVSECYIKFLLEGYPPYARPRFYDYVAECAIDENQEYEDD